MGFCFQGFDVTVIDDGNGFGSPDDVCMQGNRDVLYLISVLPCYKHAIILII